MADCHTTIITSHFTRTKINCYVVFTKKWGKKGCLIGIILLPTRYDVVCVVLWEYETPFVLRATDLCPLVDVLTFIKGSSWKERGTDCDSQHLTTRKQSLILYPYIYIHYLLQALQHYPSTCLKQMNVFWILKHNLDKKAFDDIS